MTKRFVVPALLAMVAVLGITLDSQADGLFRRQRGGDPCATPAPIKYEERKVTCYKYVSVKKEIDVIYCKLVTTDVKYTYNVCVPVTKEEKRMETIHVRQRKEVPYTYTVLVPRAVTKVVKQTTYDCKTEKITECVPVCKLMRVTTTDNCGSAKTCIRRVTVMENRTRCIVKKTPIVRDVTVTEIVCDRVEKVGKRIICEYVPQTREVTVKLCSYQKQQREGVRKVCTVVQEPGKAMVNRHVRVPYETTIRVAVGCSEGRRCGLFRRHSGCNGCN